MSAPSRPPVLGLTGGIGSGKSAAANRFAELGVCVVDTDVVAHQLTAPGGEAITALREAFGAAMINAEGALDRAVMRRLVFADSRARSTLEGILHPLIRARCEALLNAARTPYVVLVVPLLVEHPYWLQRCDRVLLIDCPEAVQIERVMSRSGISRDEVQAIIRAQASREARRAIAHEIIDNAGDFDSLRAQVDSLHARCLSAAATWSGSLPSSSVQPAPVPGVQ